MRGEGKGVMEEKGRKEKKRGRRVSEGEGKRWEGIGRDEYVDYPDVEFLSVLLLLGL